MEEIIAAIKAKDSEKTGLMEDIAGLEQLQVCTPLHHHYFWKWNSSRMYYPHL
jgi:hypothetical protein